MQNEGMKKITLLLVCTLCFCGCATYTVVDQSKHEDKKPDGSIKTWYNPAYFLLFPITVPVDIVTYPFQLLLFHDANIQG
jgi:hypothetical protein